MKHHNSTINQKTLSPKNLNKTTTGLIKRSKRSLILLLGLSVLTSISSTSFAGEKPVSAELKVKETNFYDTEKMTEEELAIFKHKLRFEESLSEGTRAYLFHYGYNILKRTQTVEDESLIREIDVLLKKKFHSSFTLTKKESEKLNLLMLKLIEPSVLKK